MDLPPASSPAAREGSPEGDAMAPVHAGLAKDAALLFQSRRYAECVERLKHLLHQKKQDCKDNDKREDDPKILHNIAVTEYFYDGGSDPKRLLYELDKVKKKIEGLARTVGEPVEITGSPGSNIIPLSRGSSATLFRLSAANTGCVAYADEFDPSVVTFNIAVILYNLHEYKCALSVLLPLYQNIEPIDEPIALHICLLLLDVALASQDASTAADVILYLEKKTSGGGYTLNSGDNVSASQIQSSNQGFKISAATNITTTHENSSSDSSASANVSENPPVGTSSDDVIEFENLYSTLDGGGHNLGRPASNDLSRTSVDWVAPAFDLNLKLHLYKVRLLLLTKNQKATKREVKLAMNDVRGRDSSTELILKSQVEYGRCNFNKAIKLLQASSNRTEPAMQIIFDNNLGCIFHQLGKYNLSHVLFTRALKANSEQLFEKPRKLSTFSQNKTHYIMYNCGIGSLVCGKPLSAAHAFRQAAPIFDNRPLFWLRSAECCLLALKMGFLKSNDAASSREEIKVHVVGSGRWRQLVVDDTDLRGRYSSPAAQDRSVSLPFARECLCKALVLLDNFEARMSQSETLVSASEENQMTPEGIQNSNLKNAPGGDAKPSNAASSGSANANDDFKEVKGTQSSNTTLQISVAAYTDMCRKENHIIKQAVLGDLAYVELCLEDPLRALHTARLLQKLPNCSRLYCFLSRLYSAEALCHLNKLQEAADELSVYIRDDRNIDLPYKEEDLEKWSTTRAGDSEESKVPRTLRASGDGSQDWGSLKPEEAQGVLYTNLAAMFAMKGDLEQAGRFAEDALSCLPNNPRATLAAVYVDIKQGKAQDAVVSLRQSRHVTFLATVASRC